MSVFWLPQFLIRNARQQPERVAVIAGQVSITYGELDQWSDRLAAVLAARGVKRGDRVGIFLPKSIGAVVAMHGIMKAGAAYVPIDPASPPARAAYILENCGIQVLVSSGRSSVVLARTLQHHGPVKHVVLADEAEVQGTVAATVTRWTDVLASRDEAPAVHPVETDLAYILYTSGSTGAPKGVMISHRNALTFVDWAQAEIGVTAGDRLSSHAPLHFDLSIFDFFVAFKAGASVNIVPEGLSSFPFRLAEWIDRERISVWYSVPTILSLLVRSGDLARLRFENLRTIIFAGEVFPVKYLRDLMTAIPRAAYYNFYGPTETNVITSYRVPVLEVDRSVPIPIGKPCGNMEVFALDDGGAVVTRAGDTGELYARGPCVACGYWGDADKTARHFVEGPLPRGFRETVYCTGDIVALDDEGNYLFLGRRDNMVKSRGYRIELGEVETALYRHKRVREAAVFAVPDPNLGNRLIAVVVADEGEHMTTAELQEFCTQFIPRYMVPEAIEFRDTLPKTSTGKVDRVSLARDVARVGEP
jgi:amino acid adenylation domain-containing protein